MLAREELNQRPGFAGLLFLKQFYTSNSCTVTFSVVRAVYPSGNQL